MAKKLTPNIGLELTDSTSTLFKDWWVIINGEGSGENLSNMQKIDAAVGDLTIEVNKKVEKTVDDLTNYYTKSNTYTKTEVNELISAIETLHLEVVQELPQQGVSNTIYLVLDSEAENNIYKEYIWVNNEWELIGSTEVDLSNYYTKTQVDTSLAGKQATLVDSGANQNIKTINGTSILGSGNISTATPFPSSWRTDSLAHLIADVEADQNAVVGKTYLGEVIVDARDGLFDGNAEFMINIMDVQSGDKVLWCIASSATTAPYHWEATFVGGQISPNGCISFQPIITTTNKLSTELISGLANVATTGDYNELSNKPTIPDAVSGTNDGTNWTSITIGDVTKNIPAGGGPGGSTAWGQITGTLSNQTDLQAELDNKADEADLADVAFSGDYNDLVNKTVINIGNNIYWESNPTAIIFSDEAFYNINAYIIKADNNLYVYNSNIYDPQETYSYVTLSAIDINNYPISSSYLKIYRIDQDNFQALLYNTNSSFDLWDYSFNKAKGAGAWEIIGNNSYTGFSKSQVDYIQSQSLIYLAYENSNDNYIYIPLLFADANSLSDIFDTDDINYLDDNAHWIYKSATEGNQQYILAIVYDWNENCYKFKAWLVETEGGALPELGEDGQVLTVLKEEDKAVWKDPEVTKGDFDYLRRNVQGLYDQQGLDMASGTDENENEVLISGETEDGEQIAVLFDDDSKKPTYDKVVVYTKYNADLDSYMFVDPVNYDFYYAQISLTKPDDSVFEAALNKFVSDYNLQLFDYYDQSRGQVKLINDINDATIILKAMGQKSEMDTTSVQICIDRADCFEIETSEDNTSKILNLMSLNWTVAIAYWWYNGE